MGASKHAAKDVSSKTIYLFQISPTIDKPLTESLSAVPWLVPVSLKLKRGTVLEMLKRFGVLLWRAQSKILFLGYRKKRFIYLFWKHTIKERADKVTGELHTQCKTNQIPRKKKNPWVQCQIKLKEVWKQAHKEKRSINRLIFVSLHSCHTDIDKRWRGRRRKFRGFFNCNYYPSTAFSKIWYPCILPERPFYLIYNIPRSPTIKNHSQLSFFFNGIS